VSSESQQHEALVVKVNFFVVLTTMAMPLSTKQLHLVVVVDVHVVLLLVVVVTTTEIVGQHTHDGRQHNFVE